MLLVQFLDQCTVLLDLPFSARRLFDKTGVERFNLSGLTRDELVYVTCGEPWSDPTLSKTEQQRHFLLSNIAADVAQMKQFVRLRNADSKSQSLISCDPMNRSDETPHRTTPYRSGPKKYQGTTFVSVQSIQVMQTSFYRRVWIHILDLYPPPYSLLHRTAKPLKTTAPDRRYLREWSPMSLQTIGSQYLLLRLGTSVFDHAFLSTL